MIDVTQAPYNAVGDGVANDSLAIQAALNAGERDILFPVGRAFRCNNLLVPSWRRLFAEGATLVTSNNVGAPLGRTWILATQPGASDVLLRGGRLVGETTGIIPGGGFFIGFRGDSLTGGRLESVDFEGFGTDGAHFGGNTPCDGIVIEGCYFAGARRNNLSIVNATGVAVSGCLFTNTTGNNPGAGIDIEPNANERVDDITVTNCVFDNCSVGIYDQRGNGLMGTKHRLLDNQIRGSRRIGIVANSIRDLIISGNNIEGPAIYPGPPQLLTIGITAGAFNEASRTSEFTISGNRVRGHSRHLVLAGVQEGEVVRNDSNRPEAAGMGISGDMLIAKNFVSG